MTAQPIRLLAAGFLLAITVFTFVPLARGQTLEVLHSFNGSDGFWPVGTLLEGSDGNLYGTTTYGGAFGQGTVFKVTTNGTLVTLVSFNNTNGASLFAGLVLGNNGNFYGTTAGGGAYTNQSGDYYGTIFRLTPDGVLTTLVALNFTNGPNPQYSATPLAELIQAQDGNFYGTTYYGGSGDYVPEHPDGLGTVFRMTPSGVFTTLASFDFSTHGGNPRCPLLQGSDGNFYGTAGNGGPNGYGTIFKMTPDGALTALFSFSNTDGASPTAGLLRGNDGNFYGTTERGGAFADENGHGYGTVFRMTTTGIFTSLVSFNFTNGAYPGKLLQASDGNFYGTSGGGDYTNQFGFGYGTIFRMTPDGSLTSLVSFNGTNGSFPFGGMIQGSDGNFYGTTMRGGVSNSGTIFRLNLSLPAPAPVIASQPRPLMAAVGSNTTFSVTVGGGSLTYQWRFNGGNINGATNSSLTINNVRAANVGNYSVAVTNLGGFVISANAILAVPNGVYRGLFHESSGVTQSTAGFFRLTAAPSLKFSGRVFIDGLSYHCDGRFDSGFSAHTTIKRTHKTALNLDLQLVVVDGTVQVTGTISDVTWTAPLLGHRADYSRANPCPQRGSYAMTLLGSGDNISSPNYGSHGVVKVSANGTIILSGAMGDDSRISQFAFLSKDGQWPLYVPLYAKSLAQPRNFFSAPASKEYKGSLLGWITFTNQPASPLRGTVSWIKTAASGKYYVAGFTNTMSVFGSLRK